MISKNFFSHHSSPITYHLKVMIQFFDKVRVDWLGRRKIFIGISAVLMLAGLASALVRQAVPGGTDAFNLGVDFKGGTVVTVKFLKDRPSDDQLREQFAKKSLTTPSSSLRTSRKRC